MNAGDPSSVHGLSIKSRWLVPIGLVLLTGVMLHACWDGPLYHVDDRKHLTLALRGTWPDVLLPRPDATFLPVTLLSYRVDWHLLGPGGTPPAEGPDLTVLNQWAPRLRLANGVYHCLAGLLLWLLLRRLQLSAGLAVVVALLWTGHPMACESVCWIAERKNVLAALFGFGALLAWTIRRDSPWRWPLVWLLFALAVCSKPSALGLLPLLVGLELADPVAGTSPWRCPRGWVIVAERLAIPVLIVAGAVYLGVHGHRYQLVEPPGGSVWTALLTDLEIFARYAAHILVPAGLSFYCAVDPIAALSDLRVWLYAFALGAGAAALLAAALPSRRRLAALGLLAFFGGLGPSANLLALPYWMQDRYAYLAAPGLLWACALAAEGAAARARLAPVWLRCAGCAAVLAFAVLLGLRSPLFRDSDRLQLDAAERQPRSGRARLAAGLICFEKAQALRGSPAAARTLADDALRHFQAAEHCSDVGSHADSLSLHVYQAHLLIMLGRHAEALRLLEPLPPPDMELASSATGTTRSKRTLGRTYTAATLAAAFQLRADALLGWSRSQDLPPERKRALEDEAAALRAKAEELLQGARPAP